LFYVLVELVIVKESGYGGWLEKNLTGKYQMALYCLPLQT
jgi:hypothetical protein